MKKQLQNLLNKFEAFVRHYTLPDDKGLLHFKEDDRDRDFVGGGDKIGSKDYGYRFHQRDNICVFASRELGRSQQDGVRWSVRFTVKLARKLGYTQKNGYSYLRAANKIAKEYGRIPYVLMPDENQRGQWNEYSRWTDEDEKLLDIAKKYRIDEYQRIRTDEQAIEAIEQGHSIFTAVNWYSTMNSPQPPNYLLKWAGIYVGGHAILYDEKGDKFHNLQTFGPNYGDNGYAYTRNLMPNIIGGAYVETHYEPQLLADMVSEHYEGFIIRDIEQPECYVIEGGKKRHIKTIDEYVALGGKHHTVAAHIIELIPNI